MRQNNLSPKMVAATLARMEQRYVTADEILSEAIASVQLYDAPICRDTEQLKDSLRELYRKGRIEFKEVASRQFFRLRPELDRLGWQSTREDTGMFLDDRMRKTRRNRRMNPQKIVAWLNCKDGVFSVNVVSGKFEVTHPIPASTDTLGDAVRWVYCHSRWIK